MLGVSSSAWEPEDLSVVKAKRARVAGQPVLELEVAVTTRGKRGDCGGSGTVTRERSTRWTCVDVADAGVGCDAEPLPGLVDVVCAGREPSPDAGPLAAGLPVGATWVERLRVVGEDGAWQTRTRKTVLSLDGGVRALELTPLASRGPLGTRPWGPSMASVVLPLGADAGAVDLRGDRLVDAELGQGAGRVEFIVAALLPSATGATVKPLGARRHALGPAHAYSVAGGGFDTSASMGGVSEQWTTSVRGEVVILDGTGIAVLVHLAGRRDYERSGLDWAHCDEACVNGPGPRVAKVVERSSSPLAVELTLEPGR
jgi:hypothetical protein